MHERGVGEEVREALPLEGALEARRVCALGKPDARRLEPGQSPRRCEADGELGLDGSRVEQREVAVRRRGGEDLDLAGTRQVGEGPDEIAPEALDERLLQARVRRAV